MQGVCLYVFVCVCVDVGLGVSMCVGVVDVCAGVCGCGCGCHPPTSFGKINCGESRCTCPMEALACLCLFVASMNAIGKMVTMSSMVDDGVV